MNGFVTVGRYVVSFLRCEANAAQNRASEGNALLLAGSNVRRCATLLLLLAVVSYDASTSQAQTFRKFGGRAFAPSRAPAPQQNYFAPQNNSSQQPVPQQPAPQNTTPAQSEGNPATANSNTSQPAPGRMPGTRSAPNAPSATKTLAPVANTQNSTADLERSGGFSFRVPGKNFEVLDPGPEWVRDQAVEASFPEISLALSNKTNRLCFTVIVNEIGSETSWTTPQLVRASQTTLAAWMKDSEFGPTTPKQVAGMDGLQHEATGKLVVNGKEIPIVQVHWAAIHNGFAIQCLMRGSGESRMELLATAEHVRSCFRLIEPNRVARASSIYHTLLDSPRWGMHIDLAGTGWVQEVKGSVELTESKLLMIRPEEGFFQVQCYSLLGQRVHRNTAIAAVLAQYKLKSDDPQLIARNITFCDMPALQVDYTLGSYTNTVTMVFSEHLVWSISLLLRTNDTDRQQVADKLLGRVKLARREKVLTAQNLTANEKTLHVAFFNELARYAISVKQVSQACEYSAIAHALAPNNITLTENLVDLLVVKGDHQEALRVLETAPPGITIEPERQALLAQLLAKAGRNDEALETYRRLFETDFSDDRHLENYLVLLGETDKIESALKVAEASLARRPNATIVLVHAALLGKVGQHDQQIAEIQKYRENSPLAGPDFTYALIDALLVANRNDEALRETQGLLDAGLDGTQTLLFKGLAEMKLDRLQEARRTFEAVLEVEKENPTARRCLEIVAAKLGQGDTHDIREPILPVSLPAVILQAIAAKPKLQEGDNAWTALSARAINFIPEKDSRSTLTTVVHILDRNGVEAFGSLQFPFSPLQEEVFLNRLEVFDEYGKRMRTVTTEDCYVRSYSESNLATSKKALNVPVPGLHPGCRLEYQITYRNRRAPREFPFLQHDTARQIPTARALLYVTGDVSSVRWAGSAPAKVESGLLWDTTNPARLSIEVLQDDLTVADSVVTLGDRRETWEEGVHQYLRELKDLLVISPQIKQIVAEKLLKKPNARPEEKVNLLAGWVQQQLTYQGLEFGRRGQIPPPVDETLRNRFGDCKDHSLLLWQLLRAAGLPAHLAVVNAGKPIVAEIPSMDQFNHMIVYVEDDRGPRFVDGTGKYSDPSLRVPYGLALAQVLILDEEKPRFEQIPDYAKDSARLFIDRTITVHEHGDAEVSEVLHAIGYSAAIYREALAEADSKQRRDVVQAVLIPRGSGITLKECQVEHLNDNSKSLIIRAKYDLNDLMHEVSGQLVGRLPAFTEANTFEMKEPVERETPFRLRQMRDVTSRTRVSLPSGFELAELPKNVSKTTSMAELARVTSQRDSTLEIRTRVRRFSGLYEASEWKMLQNTLTESRQLFTPKAHLRRQTVQSVKQETAAPKL